MHFDFPWLLKVASEGSKLFSIESKNICDLNVEFSCLWSDSSPRSNLLLVLKGLELNDVDAKSLGFVPSEYGYYKYLKNHIVDEHVCIDIKISPAVTDVWIIPFCTKAPVHIKGLKVSSKSPIDVKDVLDQAFGKENANVSIPVDAVAINANVLKFGCGGACCIHFGKWFDSMDGVASRWGDHLGRDNVLLNYGDEPFPAILFRGFPALLRIPSDISEWLYEIGDKSRNMISKARRLGYCFKDIDPSEVGQDIYEVRISDPVRQGKSIPEYFHTNPPRFVIDRSKVNCHHHDELFIGVFLGEKLVSYITLFVFGQLAEINHILCHNDHLNDGVMNFNLYCAVNYLIENNKEVKYLNYLYVNENKTSGIDLFKKSMGFKPRRIFIYDGVENLQGFDVPALQPKVKERKLKDEGKAVSKKYRPDNNAEVVVGEIYSNIEVSARLAIDGGRIVFAEAPAASDFVKFWSSGIRILAQSFAVGTFLAIRFPKVLPEKDEYGISNYLRKRFKANPIIDVDGLRCGFKGGSFRLAGYFDSKNKNGDMEGVLVIEKVSE